MAYGSSRIPKIQIVEISGGTGPTGPTGPTGDPGNYVTGPDGVQGRRITSIQGLSSDAIRIFLIPGPNIDLTGITAANSSGDPDFSVTIAGSPGSISPVQMGPGITLLFRPIELKGSLEGSYVGNDFLIKGLTESSGYQGSLIPGSLLYVGQSLAGSQFNLISAASQKYSEFSISGFTLSNLESVMFGFYEDPNTNNNYTVNPITINSTLNAAFYGNFNIVNPDKISFTVPYLRINSSHNLLNDVSFSTVTHVFTAKSNYTKLYSSADSSGDQIGSCCYCDAFGVRFCKDYVSRAYCLEKMSGSWSPTPCYLRYESEDCYLGGACCVNDRCVISTKEKCENMGGLYAPGENCSSIGNCESTCDFGCCCVDGVGYKSIRSICSQIQNSRFFDEPCSEVNCCISGYAGACCIRKECFDNYTALECAATGGVFQGPNSVCASQFINCCTEPFRNTPS